MEAHYKMETIEHFARISLVARSLGREHLLSREEVVRLQGLRGAYGITSPAALCLDDDDSVSASDTEMACQIVQTLQSSEGARLVPDNVPDVSASDKSEIRLTYRELTALIEDAVKHLR